MCLTDLEHYVLKDEVSLTFDGTMKYPTSSHNLHRLDFFECEQLLSQNRSFPVANPVTSIIVVFLAK